MGNQRATKKISRKARASGHAAKVAARAVFRAVLKAGGTEQEARWWAQRAFVDIRAGAETIKGADEFCRLFNTEQLQRWRARGVMATTPRPAAQRRLEDGPTPAEVVVAQMLTKGKADAREGA